jgi:hypothetical protein
MPPETQQPVFYGPKQTRDEIFPLLSHRAVAVSNISRISSTAASAARPTATASPSAVRVHLEGQGNLVNSLRAAIQKHPELVLDTQRPDVVLQINAHAVTLYHVAGQRLQTLSAAIPSVLNALLAYRTGQQLGSLYNPVTPFQVELWLDAPGKTQFKRNDRVTLYYRVQKLPYPRAYLTLLNLAPDGTLAMLYPQPNRNAAQSLRQIYLNAPVVPGRIHTIPQGQSALRSGENVALDLRLRLAQPGTERFKAIITPHPLAVDQLDARLLAGGLNAADAPAFVARLKQNVAELAAKVAPKGWGVGDLRVVVE